MQLTPEQARFVAGYYQPNAPTTPTAPARPPAPTPAHTSTPPPAAVKEADPGKHISAAARDAFGLGKISKQAQAVLDVVRVAHQAGVQDLTGREIRDWWRKVNVGQDIDTSTLSPRIGELISSGLLERLPKRFCTVTNIPAGPVRAVAQQTRLAA